MTGSITTSNPQIRSLLRQYIYTILITSPLTRLIHIALHVCYVTIRQNPVNSCHNGIASHFFKVAPHSATVQKEMAGGPRG
jgi:hypothetical protein